MSLLHVTRGEWGRTRRSRTTWVLVTMLAGAGVYGLLSGALTVRGYTGMVEIQASLEDQRLRNLRGGMESGADYGLYHPANPGAVGFTLAPASAVLPPAPLSGLAIGQIDVLPIYHRVVIGGREAISSADDEEENPERLALGRFDLAFVLVYLFPLVLLALTYDVVSAERESGTLALVLTHPVGLGEVLAGKLIARGALVVAVVLGLALVGAGFGVVQVGSAGLVPALLSWLGLTIAYAAFWLLLAGAVNAWGTRSDTNAVILVTAWLAFTLVLPSAMNMAAERAHPLPSRILLTNAQREATATAEADGADLLSSYYGDHPELLPEGAAPDMDSYFSLQLAVAETVREEARPVLEEFEGQIAAQRAVVDRYRFASAALLMNDGLTALAGTGVGRHAEYMRQVDAFEDEWLEFFRPRILAESRLTPSSLDSLPRFSFQEPTMAVPLARAGIDALGLLVPVALLALLTILGVRRYPVV